MSQLLFYLGYALRNLWRSRRWSGFAIFSVAAGVATMVAFRSLGLSIGDSLVGDVRNSNKGDITVTVAGDRFFSAQTDPNDNSFTFTNAELDRTRQWVAERGAEITEYRLSVGMQLTKIDAVTAGRPQFINSFYIDPATYPITDPILAQSPAGVPLNELLVNPTDVVISQNLAEREGITLGDSVRVSGSETLFTVTGIVPTSAQAGLQQFTSREILSLFFGFAYFDRAHVRELLGANDGVNRVSINLPDGTPPNSIPSIAFDLSDTLNTNRPFGYFEVRNSTDLLRTFSVVSDVLGRFIVVLGLGAMLLGGVGIINTMLVLVRRRTDEIAALKTFGLKGRQVAAMFMAEAFWLGLFGSIVGAVAGIGLSAVANRFGEDLIQQPLRFRIYPEAIAFGLVLGVTVSLVFGVLPVLSAARVRPASILRPNDATPVNAGCLPGIMIVVFMVVALGLIAGQIIGVWWVGLIGVTITLLILFVIAMVLWVVVWLLGKLPAFGSVDLNLALRNLTTRRMRTATTLLALSAGMFALSSISFFGESARDILRFTFSDALGGNVLIFPLLPQEIARPIIDARLNTLEGVESRTRLSQANAYAISVNGEQVRDDNNRFNWTSNLIIRDTDDPNWSVPDISAGRTLTQADRGQPVAVVQTPQITDPDDTVVIPYAVGDRVTMRTYEGDTITLEIVGIAGTSTFSPLGGLIVPPGVVPNGAIDFTLNLVNAAPENLNTVLLGLSSIPLVLTFDISFFDGILTRLITQFSALPLVVGIFSLGAAAVINANTVALSVLERRRQIGVLRAVGLQDGRVLRILILENVIISLLGGVIGLGLSALGVYIMTLFGLDVAVFIPANAIPVALLLVAVSVAIGTLAALASGVVAVRERITTTLRYE
jgi:ABC-type antimicrobial peptide transport system permease subunit